MTHVMKRTQLTELLSNIKATFVSFFSILMFVALGAGIFIGIASTAPAMQSSASQVFEEGSFHDFQIVFPYGLTADDLEQLEAIEGVSEVEPGYQSFQTYDSDNGSSTVKVQSIGASIDKPIVRQGSLPQSPGEIAL